MTRAILEQITGAIDAAGDDVGIFGIAAQNIDTGEEILLNPDEIFPTASTFKTILLWALYRQIDAGKIDPARRITISDDHRVPGSGVIQDLDAGAALTIKDIATLMISVSDNSGTDIIFHLLGQEVIDRAISDLGMEQTAVPLPTWALLAGQQNLDPDDPDLTYEELKRRLKVGPRTFDCNALKETRENDISTPRDMLRLQLQIDSGDGLSPDARNSVLDILKRQKERDRMPARLPRPVTVAHKTGSIIGVRNDVGLVYDPSGVRYALAMMSKRSKDETMAVRMLGDISKMIYEYFTASSR